MGVGPILYEGRYFRLAAVGQAGYAGIDVPEKIKKKNDLEASPGMDPGYGLAAVPDLLMFKGGRRIGVEFRRSDAPAPTPSMRIAMHDLKLDELEIAYPGNRSYTLSDGISAAPLGELAGA